MSVTEQQQGYHLSLKAMIETARWLPQATLVASHVLSGLPKDLYHIRILLQQGEVLVCEIRTKKGTVLQGKQAMELLQRAGTLDWTVSAGAAEQPQAVRPEGPHWIPAQRMHVTPSLLEQLSREKRQVLLLVNGVRTIEQIAEIRNKSLFDVQQLLYFLKDEKIIQ